MKIANIYEYTLCLGGVRDESMYFLTERSLQRAGVFTRPVVQGVATVETLDEKPSSQGPYESYR